MATPKHLQRATPQYEEFTIDGEQPNPAVALTYRQASRPAVPAERVLIPRHNIDDTLPWAKGAASLLCWVNSGVTTILTTADIQVFTTRQPSTWAAWVGGFAVALVLTGGQVYTAKRTRVGYSLLLFPDALMTSYQWCSWWLLPFFLRLLGSWPLAALAAAIVGGIIGIVSARLPERLTFGK
jgi:hypothetical protein